MNLFQWLTIPPLVALALLDLSRVVFRRPRYRPDLLVRTLIWSAGATAIYDPMITVRIAHNRHQRGTDLIVYVFVLAFLGTTFFIYSRIVRMQRQITELIRYIAIREAEQKPPTPPATTA